MRKTEKSENAVCYKHNGMNCCQAVIAAYADELGLDMETVKKLGSAFGMGMGNMSGNCGALVGAQIVLGMREYSGRPISAKARSLYAQFVGKCGASTCIDIKGVTTGRVLCSCDDCVANAVDILEEMAQ
ncbi:MAG TPA: hypothetical protein DEO32_01065 [Ruminococcaceae bacterium]|nr:hypothetical protein [Oscillospiraceae bacterium]